MGRDHSCETCGRGGFDGLECVCGNVPESPDGWTPPWPYHTGRIDATDAALAWLSGDLPSDDRDLAWCPVERLDDAWAWCLANNLRVAAGLTIAYWTGQDAVDALTFREAWWPGCGKPAPGWGGGE